MKIGIDIGDINNLNQKAWEAVSRVIADGFTAFRIQEPHDNIELLRHKLTKLVEMGAEKILVTISNFRHPGNGELFARLTYRLSKGLISPTVYDLITKPNGLFTYTNALPPFNAKNRQDETWLDQELETYDKMFKGAPSDIFVFQIILEPYTRKHFWGLVKEKGSHPNELDLANKKLGAYFHQKGYTVLSPSFTKEDYNQGGDLKEPYQVTAGHFYHNVRKPGTSQFIKNTVPQHVLDKWQGGILDAWNKYASVKWIQDPKNQWRLNQDWGVDFLEAKQMCESINMQYFFIHKLIDTKGVGIGLFDGEAKPKPCYQQLLDNI